ncbi:hypothetical protein HZS_3923, partial [Henneguya salminicola]
MIKKDKKLPKIFFTEGFSDILNICDEVLDKIKPTTDTINEEIEFKPSHKRNNSSSSEEMSDNNLNEIFQRKKDIKIQKNIQINVFNETTLTTKPSAPNDTKEQALKKSIKTIFNKVSDKNMNKILSEFKTILNEHGMNQTSDEFASSFVDFVIQPTLLPDRFILIYTTFSSIIHTVIGNEISTINIGYVLIQDLVKKLLDRFCEQDVEMLLQILKCI